MKDTVSTLNKGKNYKKVSFIANALFISVIAGTIGYNNYEVERKEKIFNSLYIGFSEVREVEYGTPNYDTLNLVQTVDNGVIDDYTRQLDTSMVGVQELKYAISEEDVTKEYSIQIEVKDTKLPIVEFKKDTLTVYKGSSVDYKSNIKSVRDEIDGELPYSDAAIENSENGYYLISSDFNKNKLGTYTVKVKAFDKNGNETSGEYKIKVIAKPVPKVVTTSSSSSSSKGNYTGPSSVDTSSVVNAAKSLIGSRYVYASASPSVGFDCSGLVNYVYGFFGKSLPRTTSGLRWVGSEVSEENMQPGDIIVWSDNGYSPTHVSIYIGGGQMVHAANKRVGVVQGSVSGWKSGGRNKIISIRRV